MGRGFEYDCMSWRFVIEFVAPNDARECRGKRNNAEPDAAECFDFRSLVVEGEGILLLIEATARNLALGCNETKAVMLSPSRNLHGPQPSHTPELHPTYGPVDAPGLYAHACSPTQSKNLD